MRTEVAALILSLRYAPTKPSSKIRQDLDERRAALGFDPSDTDDIYREPRVMKTEDSMSPVTTVKCSEEFRV